MFRPIAVIFRLFQFCSKSATYMSRLRSDVEISSSFYVLQVSLSSGMFSGSRNGGIWTSLVGQKNPAENNNPEEEREEVKQTNPTNPRTPPHNPT